MLRKHIILVLPFKHNFESDLNFLRKAAKKVFFLVAGHSSGRGYRPLKKTILKFLKNPGKNVRLEWSGKKNYFGAP